MWSDKFTAFEQLLIVNFIFFVCLNNQISYTLVLLVFLDKSIRKWAEGCKYILTPILFPFKFKLKGSPAAESDKEVSKIKSTYIKYKNTRDSSEDSLYSMFTVILLYFLCVCVLCFNEKHRNS
jgi:hypothetical protein